MYGYQEELLDHYQFPRNRKVISHPTVQAQEVNPSCGDMISIMLLIIEGVITDIGFEGKGCIISQATASLLSESCKGKSVSEVSAYNYKTIESLIKMPLGPNRMRCALISLEALKAALEHYKLSS